MFSLYNLGKLYTILNISLGFFGYGAAILLLLSFFITSIVALFGGVLLSFSISGSGVVVFFLLPLLLIEYIIDSNIVLSPKL